MLKKNRIEFDSATNILLLLLLVLQLVFNNGLLLFFGFAVFGILFYKIQKPYKPAIFTIILIYHFVQIVSSVWLSNYLGLELESRSNNMPLAIFVSFAGLICLFGPVIYVQNKLPNYNREDLKKYADKFDIMRIFYSYVISFFLVNTLLLLAFSNPGLTQFLISFAKIKWFFFILFAFMVILKKQMRIHFLIAISIEVFIGLASYFSEFKTVFFYVFFVLLVFLTIVRIRHFILGAVLLILATGIGIYWTSIKMEYRQFLNKGSGVQAVSVSRDEALGKLVELSKKGQFGKEDASVNFLDRLQYCFHLAKAMDRVPAVIPFQNGDNLGESISFVFKPRLFFPDKPFYDASEKASKYTGIGFARVMQGTSISLGYFADCYVDFGVPGMFIPLIILGIIYGFTYFYFIKNSSDNLIFNFAVVGTLYMENYAFEMDSTFLIGRLSVNLILFFFLTKFFFPILLKFFSNESAPVKL